MRVLLVDIDSLRPDHLGCYGYQRDTSPTIDAIAADGRRFNQCFTSDSPCLPSRTALATGRHGIKSGVVTHFGKGQRYVEPGDGHDQDPDRPLTFRHLSENGIHTASVSSFAKRHLAYHFSGAFRESIQPTSETGAEQGPDVTAKATTWLREHATEDDWLLHVNYWDVHLYYKDVEPFVESVRESGPPPEWPDAEQIEDHKRMTGARTADMQPTPRAIESRPSERPGVWTMPERIDGREDFEHVIDGYDASIRQTDEQVAELLSVLEAEGVREDTAVIVTADHGEAFGEHGLYGTHGMADPSCQQVPLVVSWPGVTDEVAGTAVDDFVYQFDLLPTLCEYAGVPIPDGWDGRTLRPALDGDDFTGREYLVCGHGIRTFSRTVYTDDWMYVRILHPGVFTYPGQYNDPDLPGGGLELLHDRDQDPHMTENVIEEHPAVADRLRGLMNDWLAENVATADANGTDPLVEMATTTGPYLYLDPRDLLRFYRETDRPAEFVESVERCLREFPS
jgi:arylsulfatase A-like enzyme